MPEKGLPVAERRVSGPEPAPVKLLVNGREHQLHLAPTRTLLDALRDDIGLTGTKKVCDMGNCGACTVLVDGRAVYSCLTLAVEAQGTEITTIEGLAGADGEPHPIQRAVVECDGLQCGFCTPGQVLAIKALLDRDPSPSLEDVRRGLSGNLCRCGAYVGLQRAALQAATELRGNAAFNE